MKEDTSDFKDICKQIKMRQFAPIYVLMGDEPYYIDKIVDLLEETVLSEDEKDLNYAAFFGKSSNIIDIVNEAKAYPIMAEHRLVIIKEAQAITGSAQFDKSMEYYLAQPQPKTVFVIACNGKTLDRRKKWLTVAAKMGIVYTSEKIKEYYLGPFIENMAKAAGFTIEPDAVRMITDYLGSDLKTIETTMEKLRLQAPADKRINTDLIEKSIGVSKDYQPYELTSALIDRNAERCYFIAAHCSASMHVIIPTLFNYFSRLIAYQYLPDISNKDTVCKLLQISPYAYRDYVKGAAAYSKMQTYKAVGYLREYSGKTNGINNVSADEKELLNELIFKILH